MKKSQSLFRGYRFLADIFICAVLCYYEYHLSWRDIEELLYEHTLIVSCETVRC
jgi:transposase-like protein